MDTSETALVRSLLEALLDRLEVDNRTRPVAGPDHPGLEKFVVSGKCSSDSAPKTCFIEPDRVCVNSGACEMRGF